MPYKIIDEQNIAHDMNMKTANRLEQFILEHPASGTRKLQVIATGCEEQHDESVTIDPAPACLDGSKTHLWEYRPYAEDAARDRYRCSRCGTWRFIEYVKDTGRSDEYSKTGHRRITYQP